MLATTKVTVVSGHLDRVVRAAQVKCSLGVKSRATASFFRGGERLDWRTF